MLAFSLSSKILAKMIDHQDRGIKMESQFNKIQAHKWRGHEQYTFHVKRFYQLYCLRHGKVQAGKDQEKAQSEKDSHSKNRGG